MKRRKVLIETANCSGAFYAVDCTEGIAQQPAAACELCLCVARADGRGTVQGRKLKGAAAGEPVSGGPADPVVRGHRLIIDAVCWISDKCSWN